MAMYFKRLKNGLQLLRSSEAPRDVESSHSLRTMDNHSLHSLDGMYPTDGASAGSLRPPDLDNDRKPRRG
ncbi:hypothetical protein D9758_002693 [Tetrapyrgos nigripes]|uniref:Uncharacterized protein n=1 Tax=Tetrapyrgos nigripes TaxID=182062 RepID=A0A8H5LU21_9AGAR|nr:hypothetical protein D9758_002693 [Tetrapyrgos nigripes]